MLRLTDILRRKLPEKHKNIANETEIVGEICVSFAINYVRTNS